MNRDDLSLLYVGDESRNPIFNELGNSVSVNTRTTVDEAFNPLDEGDIELVVSEHDLDGKTGVDFLTELREKRPEIQFFLYVRDPSSVSIEEMSKVVSEDVTDIVIGEVEDSDLKEKLEEFLLTRQKEYDDLVREELVREDAESGEDAVEHGSYNQTEKESENVTEQISPTDKTESDNVGCNDTQKTRINIKLEKRDGSAYIDISDNGPGIPDEERFLKAVKPRSTTGADSVSGLFTG